MKNLFARFVREEEGQDIIEYALLAAFISIVAWLILQNIGRRCQRGGCGLRDDARGRLLSGGGGS